jgi:excisionase family DNA binding protein
MQNTTVVQVQQIDVETLFSRMDSILENRLKSFTPTPSTPNDAEEFLTRDETAKILKCSTVSLWDWTNKGLLQSYRIGNKVRYKRNEVMSSPKAINAKEGVIK